MGYNMKGFSGFKASPAKSGMMAIVSEFAKKNQRAIQGISNSLKNIGGKAEQRAMDKKGSTDRIADAAASMSFSNKSPVEKRGLWDNIHAKRKRIKAGSGEKMRTPGSKGAPSAKNLKDSQ